MRERESFAGLPPPDIDLLTQSSTRGGGVPTNQCSVVWSLNEGIHEACFNAETLWREACMQGCVSARPSAYVVCDLPASSSLRLSPSCFPCATVVLVRYILPPLSTFSCLPSLRLCLLLRLRHLDNGRQEKEWSGICTLPFLGPDSGADFVCKNGENYFRLRETFMPSDFLTTLADDL